MCRQTDRQAPSVPQTHSLLLDTGHTYPFTRTDTDTPIITSLQDNSTQRRLPRLHLGAMPPLRQCVSLSYCWQEVGTAPIILGTQVMMTERFHKAGGFKLGTSCFGRWLIIGYCCKKGLISKVNRGRCKWISVKAYMCTDTRYKWLIIGFVRVQLGISAIGCRIPAYATNSHGNITHTMWRICFGTTVPCWKTKAPCQHICNCGWVLQPTWSCYLLLRVDSVCMAGKYTHTWSFSFFNYLHFIYIIFYFPAIWCLVFPFHVTFDLFHDPWRGHPSALPVHAASVTQGRCLSLSLL